MLVIPQERILDRWRDSITPPVQIIGSQYDRKRKHSDADTETKYYDNDRDITTRREESMQRVQAEDKYLIPWCKELIEKLNSAGVKRARMDSKIEREALSRLPGTLIPEAMKEYLFAKVKLDRDDRIRDGPLAKIDALFASSSPDSYYQRSAESYLIPFPRHREDIIARDYYAASRYLIENKIHALQGQRDYSAEESRSRRSSVGSPHMIENGEVMCRPTFSSSTSPVEPKLRKEADNGRSNSCSNEYCHMCYDAAHDPNLSPGSRSRLPLTPPLLRVPARRLSRGDTETLHFQDTPSHSDLHKSERSAFSLLNSSLERSAQEQRLKDINQDPHLPRVESHYNRYLCDTSSLIRPMHQFPYHYGRPEDHFSSHHDIRRHYELPKRGSDRIYDDLAFESYKALAAREHRLYSSPDSDRSEDSGFASATKETPCKGDKVTVETQTHVRKGKGKANDCFHLWEFLRDMLNNETMIPKCMEWTNREIGEFRLIKTGLVAKMWGQSKNRTSMTYEKMARAMRYYYKIKILEKVPNKRLHFRFGKHMLPKVLVDFKPSPQMQQCI